MDLGLHVLKLLLLQLQLVALNLMPLVFLVKCDQMLPLPSQFVDQRFLKLNDPVEISGLVP